MTPIRPLERGDLPAVAALYAELVKRDPAIPAPGFVDFFARTLLDQPSADPEIPSLVYEAPGDGVVGVIGSHVRRYVHGDSPVRLACSGPLIVKPEYRPRGIGALLLMRYVAGPQDLTVNDRVIDTVWPMWMRLGAVMDTAASIGWARALRPAGFVSDALTPRRLARRTPLGGSALSKLGPRLCPKPDSGSSEPLADEALLDLMASLEKTLDLRPAYDEPFLSWLFQTMESVDIGDRFLRRLVRADDGRPVGAHLMYVQAHGAADVIQVFGADKDLGLVLDHLLHDATSAGAVKVRGRVEPGLLSHLLGRGCRLEGAEWVTVHAKDPLLTNAVLSGRALVSRMDGEWWMRPRPELR